MKKTHVHKSSESSSIAESSISMFLTFFSLPCSIYYTIPAFAPVVHDCIIFQFITLLHVARTFSSMEGNTSSSYKPQDKHLCLSVFHVERINDKKRNKKTKNVFAGICSNAYAYCASETKIFEKVEDNVAFNTVFLPILFSGKKPVTNS